VVARSCHEMQLSESMMSQGEGIVRYNNPAGGWGALKALGERLVEQHIIVAGMARANLGNRSVDWEGLVADYNRTRGDIEAVSPISQGYNARICVPGGFHLTSTARERIWATPTGKANFLAYDRLCEDPDPEDFAILLVTSGRSHDQSNSTFYSLSDRYRGLFGRRDVLFICTEEIEKRGFKPGARVDLITASSEGLARRVSNFELISYPFPARSCAAYYPENKPLVPLHAYDPISFTSSCKGIPIRIVAAGSETQAA
jgi:anaerobic selenocysteine-containing dehydrogenase